MIYYLELNKSNDAHSALNLSMVKVIMCCHKNITLFSSEAHRNAMGVGTLNEMKVDYISIKVIDGGWKSWFSKVFLEGYNIFTILRKANKNKVNFVYLSSIFPISHLFLKLIKKLYPKVRLIVGLHGELEFVREGKEAKLRFLGMFLKYSFKISSNSNLKYLVFGSIIKSNFIKYNLLSPESLLSIDHPYNYSWNKSIILSLNTTIKFGTIGIGSLNKKTEKLFALAEHFRNDVSSNKICFELIGTMLPNLERFINPYVKTNGINKMLPRYEFDNQIMELNYSLFFYDNSFYKLCASGAFFDAIKFDKPIFALKNDFFEYYFEKLGNIGFLFSNLDEMKDQIALIINGNFHNVYYIQVENLKRAKQTLSIENISRDFFTQLEKK
jgi:hypothetical protein